MTPRSSSVREDSTAFNSVDFPAPIFPSRLMIFGPNEVEDEVEEGAEANPRTNERREDTVEEEEDMFESDLIEYRINNCVEDARLDRNTNV
jgi:hypothetical protein